MSEQEKQPSQLRRLVLLIFLGGALGTGAELLLARHTEDTVQWVPLILIGISLAVIGWHATDRRARSLRVLRGTMILFIISGVTGMVLHCQAKMEFKLESDPSLSGLPLFWEAMKSQTPPALAPGMMVQLGLLGLAYTYRHPALRNS